MRGKCIFRIRNIHLESRNISIKIHNTLMTLELLKLSILVTLTYLGIKTFIKNIISQIKILKEVRTSKI